MCKPWISEPFILVSYLVLKQSCQAKIDAMCKPWISELLKQDSTWSDAMYIGPILCVTLISLCWLSNPCLPEKAQDPQLLLYSCWNHMFHFKLQIDISSFTPWPWLDFGRSTLLSCGFDRFGLPVLKYNVCRRIEHMMYPCTYIRTENFFNFHSCACCKVFILLRLSNSSCFFSTLLLQVSVRAML
jgi:hypothetical protein